MKMIVDKESAMRTPVVLVGGQGHPDRAAATLMEAQGTAVISYDIERHVVRRRVSMRRAGEVWASEWILELADADAASTIHDDLLILLRRMHRRRDVDRIVVLFGEWTEPEPICHAINHTSVRVGRGYDDGPASLDVRVTAVVTCVDTGSWLAHAVGDTELDDQRSAAQVVVDQAEFADVLVLTERDQRTEAVLRRLAPRSRITGDIANIEATIRDPHPLARRGADFDPHEALLTGEPPLVPEGDVSLVVFAATGPFHPDRLHTAIDVLLDGVVRARGRLWLASQPETVVWIESTGAELCLGNVGHWLAAMDPSERAAADPSRRTFAAAQWDDDHGDRHIALSILTCGADPDRILTALRWALLTDDELSRPERWADYVDPFDDWRADTYDTVAENRNALHPGTIDGDQI
jgi:G3E family GTPase